MQASEVSTEEGGVRKDQELFEGGGDGVVRTDDAGGGREDGR